MKKSALLHSKEIPCGAVSFTSFKNSNERTVPYHIHVMAAAHRISNEGSRKPILLLFVVVKCHAFTTNENLDNVEFFRKIARKLPKFVNCTATSLNFAPNQPNVWPVKLLARSMHTSPTVFLSW